MGLFLVRVERASYRWHPQKPFLELRFLILRTEVLRVALLLRTAVLHRTCALETQLVSSRLWLRH